MTCQPTRRRFLESSAYAGLGVWAMGNTARGEGRSAGEKLNVAIVGAAGRGGNNLAGVAPTENIVALCDVDAQRLGKAAEPFPQATRYSDFRKMLEQQDIDAVVVSTPDHTHAVIATAAMKLGKHVYCEKPLAHSVYEARVMAETAKENKVVTQMGNQLHASDHLRRVVEIVRSGALGTVGEVLCWSNKIFSAGDRPQETPPVPGHIAWDLWIGPAPMRPYHPTYVPFYWRRWWDFGEGNYGDMACHIIDPAFWALDLDYPTKVSAEGPPVHPDGAPDRLVVKYEFPARGERPPVKLTWYDGHQAPPFAAVEGVKLPGQGSLIIGSEGKLLLPHASGPIYLLPQDKFADYKDPEPTLARPATHHLEWIHAIKSGGAAESSFAYGGRMTEAVHAGLVAYRAGKSLDWDGPNMRAKNCPEADQLIRPTYRQGWSL